jgi:hypothetical protein
LTIISKSLYKRRSKSYKTGSNDARRGGQRGEYGRKGGRSG